MRSHPSRARPFFGAENVTPRSIRRAAERKARKLARKADKSQMLNTSLQASACADEYFDEKLCFAEPEAGVPTPISAAQLAANRANGRGRDASCPAPPAQIRTCGIPAYGSYLG